MDKNVQIVRRNRGYKEESSQDLVVKMKKYADLGCEKNLCFFSKLKTGVKKYVEIGCIFEKFVKSRIMWDKSLKST